MKSINILKKGTPENMDNDEYIKFMESKGYTMERLHIDEKSEIVTLYDLEKEHTGKVINIRCPTMYKIFILGRNQLQKDVSPDTVSLHTLTLRLVDSSGNEISPDSRIRIIKEKSSLATMLCATMLYKDVTRTEYSKNLPNGTKPDSKLYIFDNGIQMNGEDHLKIEVIGHDLDVNCSGTKLDLDIDLWEDQ